MEQAPFVGDVYMIFKKRKCPYVYIEDRYMFVEGATSFIAPCSGKEKTIPLP